MCMELEGQGLCPCELQVPMEFGGVKISFELELQAGVICLT